MLNREIAEVTAMLVSGAFQSGQLPTGAEQVAEYYAKLYGLLAEYFFSHPQAASRRAASGSQTLNGRA